MQADEEVLDAGLGEDAGDQLDALLRRRRRDVGRRRRLVLQRLRVRPGLLDGDAGARSFAASMYSISGKTVGPIGLDGSAPDRPASGSHDAARAVGQKVVECKVAGMGFGDLERWLLVK